MVSVFLLLLDSMKVFERERIFYESEQRLYSKIGFLNSEIEGERETLFRGLKHLDIFY